MSRTDRFFAARAVADAVLYEGYVLYPYRASSRKNQVRFQFGVLTPRAFSEADGSERWSTRTECLLDAGGDARLAVRIRCLHTQRRSVEAATGSGGFVPAASIEVDGNAYVEWDEAIDEIVDVPLTTVVPGCEAHYEEIFSFAGREDTELIRSREGLVAGRIVRRREPVTGRVRLALSSAEHADHLLKVSVTVENTTEWTGTSPRRDDVMGQSLVAVHTMLAAENAVFVSLLDPPPSARSAAGACRSDGAFPVLIGEDDVVLSSPIILYDHPEVAPESPGDLYDSTEIDEILALRVLTLTDAEKSEARGTDPRAAAIIDRCDEMAPETWERLHGTMRSIRPLDPPEIAFPTLGTVSESAGTPAGSSGVAGGSTSAPWWDPGADAAVDPWTDSVMIAGVEVAKGTAVTLRPSHRSDAQDLFLHGLDATVAGVFKDVDGSMLIAVTVDSDPATAELEWQGRYLFFHPDEVEPRVDQATSR